MKKKSKVQLFNNVVEKATLVVGSLFGIFIAFTGSGVFGDTLLWVIGEGVLIIALTLASVYLTRKKEVLAVLLIFCTLFFIIFVSWPHFLSDVGLLGQFRGNPILLAITMIIVLPFIFLFTVRLRESR